jgi:hypothetical protein
MHGVYCSEVSARASKILRRVVEKQPEMFQTSIANGLRVTSDFQDRIRSNYAASSSSCGSWSMSSTCLLLGVKSRMKNVEGWLCKRGDGSFV